MQIKAILEKANEAWYSLLDSLDAKGIPVYKVIDPIENAGIPSLFAFAGLVLASLVILIFIISTILGGPSQIPITISVQNQTGALQKASISLYSGNELLKTLTTNPEGMANTTLPPGNYSIKVTKEGCEPIQRDISIPGTQELKLTMQCAAAGYEACTNLAEKLESIPIKGEGGAELENCQVHLMGEETQKLDWEVKNGHLIFGTDCIPKDAQIRIECGNYLGEFFPDEIQITAQQGEALVLTSKDGPQIPPDLLDTDFSYDLGQGNYDTIDDNGNGIPDTYETEEEKITLTVKVLDKTGKPLDGIVVKAVDSAGKALSDEATTHAGLAQINVPKGAIRVQAIDPTATYGAYTSPPFVPTGTYTIKLEKGWETKIRVTQPDGRRIPGATVQIGDISMKTRVNGEVTLALPRDTFDVSAYKEGYLSASGTVTGGGTLNLTLEPLTDQNSGSLALTIVNSQLGGLGFSNLPIRLAGENGLAGECDTDFEGSCHWRRLYAQTYDVYARLPLSLDYEKIGSLEITAGRHNIETIAIDPPEATITVWTQINEIPADGVDVKLMQVYPTLEEAGHGSTSEGYVELTGYWGGTYYLMAETSQDGKYYSKTTGPFQVTDNMEVTLELEAPKEDVSLEVPTSTGPGKFEGKLSIGLPYLDPEEETTFDKATIDLWVGDLGDKNDPLKTPILIDRIPQDSYLNMQRPSVSITGYDNCNQDRCSGSTTTDTQTSKGIKIVLSNYDAGNFEMKIPFLARLSALPGDVPIHYRVTYKKGSTTHTGEWKEKTVKISGGRGRWTRLEDNDFFSMYRAWLSLSPGSRTSQAGESIHTTVGSEIYLNVDLVAKDYSDNPRLDLDLDGLEARYFRGSIKRGREKIEIHETETGSSLDILENALTDHLEPNDEVRLEIALGVEDNGTVGLFDKTFIVRAVEVEWTPTPIPGVSVSWEGVVKTECLPDYDCESFDSMYYNDDTMLIFSPSLGTGRDFDIYLNFKEESGVTKEIYVESDHDLKLEYDNEVSGNTVTISGNGDGSEGNPGKIRIWIWAKGGKKPENPILQIEYGPGDYSFTITGTGIQGDRQFEVTDELNEFVDEVEIDASQGVDTIPINSASINGTSFEKTWDENSQTWTWRASVSLEPGSEAEVHAESDKFDLTRNFLVKGTEVNPGTDDWDDTNLDVNEVARHQITIYNYWDSDITADLTLVLNSSLDPEEESPADLEWNGFHFDAIWTVYKEDGTPIPGEIGVSDDEVDIGPGQYAILNFTVKPLGTLANLVDVNNTLKLEIETGSYKKTYEYYQHLNASVPEEMPTMTGGGAGGQYKYTGEITIIRENNRPRDLDDLGVGGCLAEIEKDEDDRVTIKSARICDAKQLSQVIKGLVNDLTSGYDYFITGTYALGYDNVTTEVLEKGLKGTNAQFSGLDIDGNDYIPCGVVDLLVMRDTSNNIEITGTSYGGPWCKPNDTAFAIGVLNANEGLSETYGVNKYSFEEGSDFLDGLPDPVKKMILGYSSELMTRGEPITLRWDVVDASELEGAASEYSWVPRPKGWNEDYVYGYVKWFGEDVYEPSPLTYAMGVVYPKNTPGETFENLASCFAENLVYNWTHGLFDGTGIEDGKTFNLSACTRPNDEAINALVVPEYTVSILDLFGNDITGEWIGYTSSQDGDQKVEVQMVVNPSDNLEYCYYSIGRAEMDNSFNPPSSGAVDITDENDGEVKFYVTCKRKNGLFGRFVSANVSKDTEAPDIDPVGDITMQVKGESGTKEVVSSVSDSGAGVGECWIAPVTDVGVPEKHLWDCSVQDLESEYAFKKKVNCTITIEKDKKTGVVPTDRYGLSKMNGDDQTLELPAVGDFALVCNDTVGNEGYRGFELTVFGEGTYLKEGTHECSEFDGEEFTSAPCPFEVKDVSGNEKALVKYNGKYYTNGDVIIYTFHLDSMVPVGCWYNVTKDTEELVSGPCDSEGSADWTCTIPLSYKVEQVGETIQGSREPADEGEYTVTIDCIPTE